MTTAVFRCCCGRCRGAVTFITAEAWIAHSRADGDASPIVLDVEVELRLVARRAPADPNQLQLFDHERNP